ncbi:MULTISPECIES: acyl-CoA desaturase [Streptomyces]|uniref:Stearoyl-CoA desaturase (Delta-9 desaturase) n=2 Tax=Streptomyces TaxID=1883 RepID=A0A1I6USN9_9ACTN|nr:MULTISPECIES: acyl-CoA desaturase [Streptomyces]SFT04471.1 stearoyl-CoA desaturase (delta-9 desaturase) [Streptomyces harbinensis]
MDGKEHRWFILAASIIPLIGIIAAMVLLWNRIFGWSDLAVLVIMYVICGFGVSTGYHRMLTHRSFETYKPIRYTLATWGAMAGQGPPIIWAAHHRRHHRVADKEGDPHSPHLGFEPGVKGTLAGVWHAHLGWLFDTGLTSDPLRYCPDLTREKPLRWISENFVLVVLAGIALPGLLGFAFTGGDWTALLTGMLWGGLVRLFLVNHLTYAVNSIGHVFGRRRFTTTDESRNVAWLAIPSFGEAWHNNHHAFPRSARHGMRWYEVDISAIFIWSLEKTRLAWKVVRIDTERLTLREAGISRVSAAGADRQQLLASQQEIVPLAERSADAKPSLVDVE